MTASRRRMLIAAGAALGLAVVAPLPAPAQDLPTVQAPIYVTSLGQSLDGFQVQLAVKRVGLEYIYEHLPEEAHEAEILAGSKTLFLAVGASLKGFGEAGITIDDEIARANRLLDAADAAGIPIVVLHVGGVERRDELSNQLINLTAPRAKALIIRNDSDADGLFAGIATANNIPIYTINTIVDLLPPLKQMFQVGA